MAQSANRELPCPGLCYVKLSATLPHGLVLIAALQAYRGRFGERQQYGFNCRWAPFRSDQRSMHEARDESHRFGAGHAEFVFAPRAMGPNNFAI